MTEPTNNTQKVHWEADVYDESMRFVSRFGESLIEWLAPKPGERVIDLGCGTGDLAARIAEAGAHVVGVDISPEMVVRAKEKYPAIAFECADVAQWKPNEPADAVFSNAALHWMKDAKAVARTVAAALKPGGRFVAEFGGKGNVQSIVKATEEILVEQGKTCAYEMPWYFPSVAEYATVLEEAGLEVVQAVLFDRPTALEGGEDGMIGWLNMFGSAMVSKAPQENRDKWFKLISEKLEPHRYDGKTWTADYRRLRIVANKIGGK